METNYLVWALHNLMNDAHNVICLNNNWEDIDWQEYPENKRPNKNVVMREIERIKNEEEPQMNYRHNRAMMYPPIGDQLDALYHAGVFPEDMANKIKEVKDKYSKSE